MNDLFNRVLADCKDYTLQGHVATYIPELANADPSKFGIYISTENDEENSAGDYMDKFSMQSIVKPLILLQALIDSNADTVRALALSIY